MVHLLLLLLNFLGLITPIRAAIIPHHQLAQALIQDLGQRLEVQAPRRVIIISPNHYEVGNSPIITTQSSLIGLGTTDPSVISNEHGFQTPYTILKNYLPHTEFIPLIISTHLSSVDMDTLIDHLTAQLTTNDILIASTDFSHYRDLTTANAKDDEIKKLIIAKNYSEILKLNNDYVDSPRSLVILLKTLDRWGSFTADFVNHSNSALIAQDYASQSTTSYFEILYTASPDASSKK